MKSVTELFIQIVKSGLRGEVLSEEIVCMITPEMLGELYRLSRKHDLGHVVAVVLQKQNILSDESIYKKFSQTLYLAVMRHENMQYELERICELFEKEHIVYILLKGAVIKNYYEEPWMRTSCDIDILVNPKDIEKACEILKQQMNYHLEARTYKDVSLFSPSGVHLELHFMIQEDHENFDKVLCEVWDHVHPIKEGCFQYEMSTEFFLFHIFSHMAYHFTEGGCGIRTFIDIWLLLKKLKYDEKIFSEMCERSNLRKFVQTVIKLSRIWFEEEEYDHLCGQLECYVITGGTYGTVETSMIAKKTKISGRFNYILQRIFIPYDSLCILYPKLKDCSILYPYYTLVRWCKILKKGMLKSAIKETKLNSKVKRETVDEVKNLFKQVGL